MNTLSVKFEMPAAIAFQAGLDLNNISHDIKQIIAFFLYEHKQISLSKACELGGFSQWEYFEMNRRLKIPILYNKEDLRKDMEKPTNV
jgi:predicted HTH domain antitoxin